MPRFMPTRTLGSLLAGLLLMGVAARAADFAFKQDAPLERVLETVAATGRFNVVVASAVAGLKTRFQVRGLDPADVLHLTARIHNLKVKKVQAVGADRPTYFVGPGSQIDPAVDPTTRVVHLKHRDPVELLSSISPSLEQMGLSKVTCDVRSNGIVLLGSAPAAASGAALVSSLDVPIAHPTARITVVAGPKNKPEPIWSGILGLASGKSGSVEMIDVGSVPPSEGATRVTTLVASITLLGMESGFVRVRAALDVRVQSNRTGGCTAKIQAEAAGAVGEELVLGGFEFGEGAVAVRIRVGQPAPASSKGAGPPLESPAPRPSASPTAGARTDGP